MLDCVVVVWMVVDWVYFLCAPWQIPEGMPIEDLIDCYVGVEEDLKELTRTGEIICVKNADKGAEVYYSRGQTFLVDLSGVVTVEAGSYLTHSSHDTTDEIRRGDAFRVGDNWFRVSAAVRVRCCVLS